MSEPEREPVADLSELLESRAAEFGAKSVYRFLDSGADWTFADLARRARRVAGQLTEVEPGTRVGILAEEMFALPSSPPFKKLLITL